MVSFVKLPILKKGEYILWTMKMEQYLAHTDYDLCEVILNGNYEVPMTKDESSNEVKVPPVTAHQILARIRERKAKSTLLMAILDEHLARFHGIKDAKTLWAAIKTRFGGVSLEDANKKFLRSLPSAWSNISLIMRNKPDINNLDIDDLYNNLKVYEADIKGSSRSSSNLRNVAFVSVKRTSNTNELNVAYTVSTATGHSSQAQGSSSYTDELMFSFFANQSGSPKLDNKNLEQIDQDDLEKIDLKWQVAMLSMRMKQFYKKTRRKLEFNGKEPVGFDKTKVECFNCHIRGHFSRDFKTAKNPENRGRDAGNAWYRGRDNGKRLAREEDEKALVVHDGLFTYDWSCQIEEEATDFDFMDFTSNPSSSNFEFNEKEELDVKVEEVTEIMFDNCSSDKENSLANDRFKKGEKFHAVPPYLTGNYMPPKPDLSFAGLNDSIFKFKISETVTSLSKDVKDTPETSIAFVEKPKEVRPSAPLIQEWETDSDNDRKVDSLEQCSKNKSSKQIRSNNRIHKGHSQQSLKNKGIVDSRCSRHMTGNKAYLADYQEINDGGFVAFGSNIGKITGKGKPRTEKLDFDDVYFVNELMFNLFSISQICDKKNSVLFTETECLVLSSKFKILDESQVLLRIPRQSNLYCFDLQNVVPSRDLTCLLAKASIDEFNL
uniref:Ribonuclease H-like domain-containing protein n=1 Tax=Tanacetum cinerariifolium TaxID=118510 RepID=A0A6L2LZS9_TANCI|nr:ribonuclease H-like domain-containing protein [Tanacetum cinerariifolium]